MQTRRTFLEHLALSAGATALPRALVAEADSATTMDYMDGYHGGIVGHMPPGSWRDILHALDTFPEWKLSLDIEPDSWVVLRERDPEAFARLSALLVAGDRVEDARLVDEFTHPKTGKRSMCYRINYRSLERTLTNKETNDLHNEVSKALVEKLGVEIR